MTEAAPPSSLPPGVAPGCGDAPTLPVGTRVGEFEVRGVLGSGGFGIVYLAWDHALEREVALKEYMPGTLAGRGEGLAVSVRSHGMADTFALGLKSFVNEARMLARFDHPSLVKVYRFWEDNGTAYMVMPRYVGRTLRQVRAGMVVPPTEAACRRVLDALLSALEVLHKEGVFHRDIAPDNILLGDDGLPVLLDFGAARRVIGEGNKALTSIMKPHFAPLEQYADQSAMRQGPWTDLYALGGTIYFLITGREPVPAASRALHDDQPRLTDLRPADCTQAFLAVVDWMLALKPAERPQSVHMLRDVLDGRMNIPARLPADRTVPGIASRDGVDIPTGPGELGGPVDDPAQASTTASDARTVLMPSVPVVPAPLPTPAALSQPPAAAPAAPARRSLLPVLAVLVALNILAWWWFTRQGDGPAASAAVAAAASSSAGTSLLPSPAPASQATAAQATSAASAPARGGEPAETILSVLPARAPRPTVAPGADAGTVAGSPPAVLPAAAATPMRSTDLPAAAGRPATQAGAVLPATSIDPQGPRARCGDRMLLTLLVCMKRECEAPALRGHPECVKMREQEDAALNHQR
jgi:serine/threonine protein kinase